MTKVDVDGNVVEVNATFCYLGDMLCSGRGCDSAIAAKCCVAWGKLRKQLPVPAFMKTCWHSSLGHHKTAMAGVGTQLIPS